MRTALRADTTVGVAAGELWEFLIDWQRQGDWIPLTRVRTVAGAGRGAGGRIEAWTGVGPLGFRDPMVIERWEPPRRCVIRHTGRWIRGEAGFEVTPIDAGTSRVTWWESVEIPFGRAGALGWRLSAPLWRAVLARSLRRMARLAESGRR